VASSTSGKGPIHWWKRHFLGAEGLLAIILTAVFVVWLEGFHGYRAVNIVLADRRGLLYSTLAMIDATLLGFVLATTAIVLGFAETPRFELLRNSKQYPTLWKIFTASLRVLGLGTVAALTALLVDRDPLSANNNIAMTAVFATSLLAAFRTARAVWALQNIVRIVTKRPPGS
jgi:hypothetical protein